MIMEYTINSGGTHREDLSRESRCPCVIFHFYSIVVVTVTVVYRA
jgi:hypothetical protein